MGMDENAQSVVQAAEANRVTPQVWVEQMADRFAGVWRRLGCSHDDWIRTTEPRHVLAVQALLRRIQQRNPDDLYMGEYEGLYCTGCEEFKQENQIVDGHCIEHPSLTLVPTKEWNHFFRLSRYRDPLLRLITSGEYRVEPAIRRNEMVRLLEAGLTDLSISRSRFPWGIPFPDSPGHTVYVWFDALINYLAATGFPEDGYQSLWPADLHVIGKGITRFHCVIWPAMLLSAGVMLPRMIWGHGYVQWEGAKMSKTAGTAVTLDEAINRYGADPLRYFLLREVGFEQDGDFTWERFDARYKADLADGLGNLAARTLGMIARYRDGVIPQRPEGTTPFDRPDGVDPLGDYVRAMEAFDLRGALEAAWQLVGATDVLITQVAPWTLAKQGEAETLDRTLAALARTLYRLSVVTFPFMPAKAGELWLALGQPGAPGPDAWSRLQAPPVGGRRTSPSVLFPKPATLSADPA